ncbi:unnamed protein product [Chrysodeixis includens]|uniref:Uncharacterized protein n=1 Tax=Chrysodeixis includens TaxID=689277 RepID=A0A9P0FXS7_CHRIL|nr:unnamed protein product [Chrysodeixis includens]
MTHFSALSMCIQENPFKMFAYNISSGTAIHQNIKSNGCHTFGDSFYSFTYRKMFEENTLVNIWAVVFNKSYISLVIDMDMHADIVVYACTDSRVVQVITRITTVRDEPRRTRICAFHKCLF